MKKVYLLLLVLLFASGCATSNQLYSWDNYPTTLYKYKKDPTEENLQKHKEMIVSIIKTSEEQGRRVPPGVYCEYGFLLLKEGKTSEAVIYFDLEEKTYPESGVFIKNIKAFIKNPVVKGNGNSSSGLAKNNMPESGNKGD